MLIFTLNEIQLLFIHWSEKNVITHKFLNVMMHDEWCANTEWYMNDSVSQIQKP